MPAEQQNVAKDTQAAMVLLILVKMEIMEQARVEAAELAALVLVDTHSAMVGILARVALVELEDLHL
jgi:hypothetical protein